MVRARQQEAVEPAPVSELEAALAQKDQQLRDAHKDLQAAREELAHLKASRGWRLLEQYRRVGRALSPGSWLNRPHQGLRDALTVPYNYNGREFRVVGSARDESIMRYLQNTGGFYEPHITGRFRELITPESVCLDIGANIGVISLALSSLATAGRVYCFEAGRRNYAFLVQTLKINRARNATALRLAVYDREGEIELSYVDDFAGAAFSSSTGYGDPRGQRETVRCVTIDDWVERRGMTRLDFIKIDVEGAEVKALTGATRTLSKFQPSLITELNPWCLKEYFGSSAEELFQFLKPIYSNIFLIERDGGLVRLRTFADLRPFVADESVVEDLLCTP